MKPITLIFFAVACVWGTWVVPAAALALAKTVPASSCQVTDENNVALARGANDIGSINGNFTISCPILRDNTTNTNGLSALQLKVIKSNATSRSCTAYAVDGFGNPLKSVTRTVSGSGIKTFDWGTAFNVSSANGATYSVLCSLGADDAAENLYWNEPNPPSGDDVKIIPGTYCKPSDGTFKLSRFSNHLSGSGDYQMQCPLLRDTFASFKGILALKVRMFHGNNELSDCQGIVADSHENYIRSVIRSVGQPGSTTLSWDISMNVLSPAGHYGLECFMGPTDEIYNIEYTE